MVPTAQLRLASMMRSVQDVILPAVAGNAYATEQAMLMLGHLHVLAGQFDHVLRYEALQLRAAQLHARQLCALAAGGAQTMAACAMLREQAGAEESDPPAIRALYETVQSAAESLIRAAAIDGTQESAAAIQQATLVYGRACADRDRAWYGSMGFEASGTQLPDIPAMLDTLERELA